MSEDQESQDKSQKTEEATAHRLEQAREKGQIPLSREINHWMIILGILLITGLFAPRTMTEIAGILKPLLMASQFPIDDVKGMAGLLGEIIISVFKAASLPFLVLIFAGLAAGLGQTQFLVSAEHIKPKFSKISPLSGLKRIFSSMALTEFFKGLFKILIIGTTLFIIIYPEFSQIPYWGMLPVNYILVVIQQIFLKLLVTVLSIMGVVAGIDYLYQRFNYLKQMRMSKQDIKDEHKQTQGDPLIKRRLAEMRREKAQVQRIATAVPVATVVITNPTHFAVALKYYAATMDTPKCVAKGQDIIAQRIRELAEHHDVPIIEDPPLARALYAGAEIDQDIPAQYYYAVARVVRYIVGLDARYRGVDLEEVS